MNKQTYQQHIISNPNDTRLCPNCNESKLYSLFRWCARICKACEYKRDKPSLQKAYLARKDHYLSVKKKTDQSNPSAYLLRTVKTRANLKGLLFDIDESDIVIPEFCPILGIKLSQVRENGIKTDKSNSPSVDRIDSSLGYVKGNVQVTSYRANMLKNNATIDELEKLLAYLKSAQGQETS